MRATILSRLVQSYASASSKQLSVRLPHKLAGSCQSAFHPTAVGASRYDACQTRPSTFTWAGRSMSNLGSLWQEERVLHVDAKIAHCVLDLGVTK